MLRSLSSLLDNLTGKLHKSKYNESKPYLEYVNLKDGLSLFNC